MDVGAKATKLFVEISAEPEAAQDGSSESPVHPKRFET
jgi:hypothetical protein